MYTSVKGEKEEEEDMDVRPRRHARRISETALRLAAEAGFSPGLARHGGSFSRHESGSDATGTPRDVNKHGGAQCHGAPVNVKTPKFNGKTAWEVFIAQFELLADAVGWTDEHRALQLALCLTEDAASCLLLLSREERGDYGALVGALQRRFGQYGQPVLLRSEFHNRRRRPGEPLRILASDIEYMCKRAYETMPPAVQRELARDQFLQALSPKELRVHTLLARPTTLNEALELAVEREMLNRDFEHLRTAAPAANTTETTMQLPAEFPVAEGEEERVAAVRRIWAKNCEGLTQQQQDKLWQVLLEFRDIFALKDGEVGLTHMVEHFIDTGDARPVKVLGRVAAAGLKLHPDKCHFLRREVEFLWHKLGQEGIGTLEEKISAIRDWPTPADQTQLKSFLGLASYYRRRLTPSGEPSTESPVLVPPDPALPFVLDTDASNVGLGAVLSQVGPDGEKVVAYFSRILNKSERRYCVTRRELLAVVTAVRHFKYYLCGAPFVVRTDHAALQWLMSFKEPEGQVAHWLEELQTFDFTVAHRAGTQHSNADALSRRPCATEGCRYCEKRE
ncbi:hypothetical protein JOB18_017623 [Solea senegalensis]|uniref:Reverse transcriptase RNase H-like domain-containing protein n=1 Tax=Solea senegalensis TaxID=28829 RepID=A0AAV6QSI1_SOLSE|nr:hypothetical protein JOB18_017623 [Solea senegalensis]